MSLQLSDNPQLRVLPAWDFENIATGIAQLLKPYQDALTPKKLQTAEQERARLLQEQQMRAKEEKEREEKEAKDPKAREQQLMEEKSFSTSTPILLQPFLLQGDVPPTIYASTWLVDS